MVVSAIPMKRKKLLEHAVSADIRRLSVGMDVCAVWVCPCVLLCVCWPVQGTAVQFNITDEEREDQDSNSNHKLSFYILAGISEMFLKCYVFMYVQQQLIIE